MRRPCSLQRTPAVFEAGPNHLHCFRLAPANIQAHGILPAHHEIFAHGGFDLKQPFIAFGRHYKIQVVKKILGDSCQQTSICFG